MFRKQYKQAYNQINGDRTQIAKILAKASEPKQAKKRYMPFRFGSLAAAVLVVCVSLYAYPQFKDIQNTEVPAPRQAEPIIAGETRLSGGLQSKVQENLQNEPETIGKQPKTENAISQQSDTVSETQQKDAAAENQDALAASNSGEDVAAYASEAEDENAIAVYEHKPVVMAAGGGGGSSSGARSANSVLYEAVRTTESGGRAEITVYAENSYLETLFNQETKQVFGGVEAVVRETGEGRTVITKSVAGWIEIYAEYVSDAELTQILVEIVQA